MITTIRTFLFVALLLVGGAVSGSALAGSLGGPTCFDQIGCGSGSGGSYTPAVNITASPESITAGQSTFVQWTSYLTTSCTPDFSSSNTEIGGAQTGNTTDYPTATKTYSVVCQTMSTPVSDSVTVTVTPATAVELTASAMNPVSIPSGIPTNLSATISNVGTLSTGAGFTNLFQIAADALGTNASDIGTYVRSGALSASSNFTANTTYTSIVVPNNSYAYFRACADKSSAASTGTITETNEANNCGPWTQLTLLAGQCTDGQDNDGDGATDTADGDCTGATDPTEQGTAPSATLIANPASVASGGSSTLTWSSNNATSCTGTGFATGGATSGSVSTGALLANANYQVSCTGSGGSANASASVTVGTASVDLNVTPDRVASGASATVSWTSSNAASCSVSGPGLSSTALSGSQSVTVTRQQTYTATCGGASDTATVNVIPRFEEF